MLQELPAAFASSGDFDSEFHLIWSDGTSHWIQAKGRAFRDNSGEPQRLMGLIMDITARKRADEELKAARQAAEQAKAAPSRPIAPRTISWQCSATNSAPR